MADPVGQSGEAEADPHAVLLAALALASPATEHATGEDSASLKELLVRKFEANHPGLESILTEYAEDPETYRALAGKVLREVGAGRDQETLESATILLTRAKAARTTATVGPVRQVNAPGGRVVIVERDVTGSIYLGNVYTENAAYDVSGRPCPYLGLQSFTFAEKDRYAGREVQVEAAFRLLRSPGEERTLLFVTGASGSGKSSFAQAGLLPRLEAHCRGLSQNPRWAVLRPGRRPLAALAQALSKVGLALPSGEGERPAALGTPAALNTLLNQQTPRNQVNLLVLDQLEEVFTQSDPIQRTALFALLVGLGSFEQVHTHVIATLRSDYLPALFEVADLYALAKAQSVELRAMTAEELGAAIRRPAEVEHPDKRWQPELVERLVADTVGQPTLLPLLQVTQEAIWNEGRLTLDRYHGVAQALEKKAEAAYTHYPTGQERPNAERQAMLALLLDLVEVSLDDDPRRDVRRTKAKRDLLEGHPERVALIDELVELRLLTTWLSQRSDSATEMVDIIHESLLSNWPRLRQAIMDERDALQRRERFRLAVQEWVDHERADDYLLQGIRLAEARELAATKDIELRSSPDAQALVERSIAQDEARAREQARAERRLRRRFVTAVLAGVLAVVAVGVALFNFSQARQQALVNTAHELVGQAEGLWAADPDLSILLLRDVVTNVLDSQEADDALRDGLVRSPARLVLRGPGAPIDTASFGPSGTLVLTGADDGSVRVWDASGGMLLAELNGHTGPINAAVWSPSGTRIAAAITDGTARVWDANTHALLATLSGQTGGATALAFSPDSSLLVTGSGDGRTRVWDAATGELRRELAGQGQAILTAYFSPDGGHVLTASVDQVARVWDLASAQPPVELRGHAGAVYAARFDSTGARVVTASGDGTARIWDARSGQVLRELQGHSGAVRLALFSPDDGSVLTASSDGFARVWDASTGRTRLDLRGHTDAVLSASFSPDGRLVATASADRTARLWDTRTGASYAELRGHANEVTTAVFAPDGQHVLTAGQDGTARVWQVTSQQSLVELEGHQGDVNIAAFSPDGEQLASGGKDRTLRLWQLGGPPVATTRAFPAAVTGLAFGSDRNRLAVGLLDGTARIVTLASASGAPDVELRGHAGWIYTIAFSPDGRRVATASADHTARVWDASNGQLIGELRGHTADVTTAAFDPQGLRLITASADGTAWVWDAASLQPLARVQPNSGPLHRAVVAPDGRTFATAGDNGSACVWPSEGGKQIACVGGHAKAIYGLAFSPDGRLLVTASADRTVRVWDTAGWRLLTELRGSNGDVTHVTFSPDGQQLVAASADALLRLYRRPQFAPLDELRGQLIPARVSRQPAELSREERARYLHES